jgi:hypothetical protein
MFERPMEPVSGRIGAWSRRKVRRDRVEGRTFKQSGDGGAHLRWEWQAPARALAMDDDTSSSPIDVVE